MSYLDQKTEQTSSINQSIMLKLYKTSKSTETQPGFRAKLASKTRHFPELEIFKIQLEDEQADTHPHLYTEARKQLLNYRMIFLGFSLFFALFAATIHFFSISWSLSFFVDSFVKTKWMITTISSMLALSAFACAYFPSTLHEASRLVVGKAKKSLHSIYNKKRILYKLNSFLVWGDKYRQQSAFRHLYHETLDKIHERGEETYRLLRKIANTPSLNGKSKEHLYNQALAELHDKLCFTIHSFKQIELSGTFSD